MIHKQEINIFCDFDGTITQKDLGNEIFSQYFNLSSLNKKLKQGELSITEYWHKLCDNLPEKLRLSDIQKSSLKYDIDPYFHKFINLCEQNEINLFIVSDGFNTYINAILKRESIDLPVSCNSLIEKEGKIIPVFSNASESCNCLSANCKRNYLLNKTNEKQLKIYIGDGYSDFCGSQHCDVIFAKNDLAAYCNENSLPHHNYKTFFDINRKLESLIKNGKLKKRNRAEILSKRAFEVE